VARTDEDVVTTVLDRFSRLEWTARRIPDMRQLWYRAAFNSMHPVNAEVDHNVLHCVRDQLATRDDR
jgi:hypothetical protein